MNTGKVIGGSFNAGVATYATGHVVVTGGEAWRAVVLLLIAFACAAYVAKEVYQL